MPIKFGTDGWRAIIAEDFTFGNVRLCAQGAADLLRAHNLAHRGFVIGYDTRFGSAEFAAAVAEVMAGNGVPVLLSDRPAPHAHNRVQPGGERRRRRLRDYGEPQSRRVQRVQVQAGLWRQRLARNRG